MYSNHFISMKLNLYFLTGNYKSYEAMMRHRRMDCKKYECYECNKVAYTRKSDLKRHLATQHGIELRRGKMGEEVQVRFFLPFSTFIKLF